MGKMTTMYMHFDHTSKMLNEIVFQDINQLKNGTLLEFENLINSPEQGACWSGDAANVFYGELREWIRDIKEYLTHLRSAINRVDQEIAEWVDRDVSYHYTPESFEVASAGIDNEDWIPKLTLPEIVKGASFKWGLKDLYPGELPWKYRLPPETNSFDLFGLFWEEETKVEDFDFGVYGGYTQDDKGEWKWGLGGFASFSLFEKTWTTSLLGIPIAFSGHLLDIGAKGGVSGKSSVEASGKGSFNLGGGSVDIAGLVKISVDGGFGGGADKEGLRLGPFNIGIDLPELQEALEEGELDLPPAPDAW